MKKDILVVGAGPAALSFAKTMQDSSLNITLIEQNDKISVENPQYDGRDIALTHSSRALFKQFNIWQLLKEKGIYPIKQAQVLDGNSPYSLNFLTQNNEKVDALGFLVSNHDLRRALYQAVENQQNLDIIFNTKVSQVLKTETGYSVFLADGQHIETKLLIAADSRFSVTRRQAGIAADINDFARTAIVSRMTIEKSHSNTAFECFHYGHTLAILPLSEHECSVVITANSDFAEQLLELDDQAYCQFVMDKFQQQLGSMRLSSQRYHYPLVGVHAKQFVKDNFALLGDASVGMHPVTAHGFNLGLSGAKKLADVILSAENIGIDFSSKSQLMKYQQKHINETRIMYYGTNGIVKLFTSESEPAKFARKAMLRLSNHFPPLKKAIENKLTQIPERF